MSLLLVPTSTVDFIQRAASPISGDTLVMDGTKNLIIVDNSSLLGAYTIQLPATPVDGQRVIITSGSGITILTIDGNGKTIKGLITTLVLNGYCRYSFSAGANAWFRTG